MVPLFHNLGDPLIPGREPVGLLPSLSDSDLAGLSSFVVFSFTACLFGS